MNPEKFFRSMREAKEAIYGITKDMQLITASLSSSELYQFLNELVQFAARFVNEPHFREPQANKFIKFDYNISDDLGNPKQISWQKPRAQVLPHKEEVDTLWIISQMLISLSKTRQIPKGVLPPRREKDRKPRSFEQQVKKQSRHYYRNRKNQKKLQKKFQLEEHGYDLTEYLND